MSTETREDQPEIGAEVWTVQDPSAAVMARLNRLPQFKGADFLAGDYARLFVPLAPEYLSAQALAQFERIKADLRFEPATLIRLRPPQLNKSLLYSGVPGPIAGLRTLKLTLPGVGDVTASQASFVEQANRLMWTGRILDPADPKKLLGDASLVFSARGARGLISIGPDAYLVSPLGDAASAVMKVKLANLPPDHVSGVGPPTIPPAAPPSTGGAGDGTTPVTIRIGIAFTPAAKVGVVDQGQSEMDAHIETILSIANLSFERSGVRIRLQLAGTLALKTNETGNFRLDVEQLENTSDGIWDDVKTWRHATRSQIVVALVAASSACGESYGVRTDQTHAYAVVNYYCALANYSLAHEIGHLLGARHDEKIDPASEPYAYGHGFVNGDEWRTIMAYRSDKVCLTCGRINRWASPNVLYKGVPTGTAARSNDARVLNENAAYVASFAP